MNRLTTLFATITNNKNKIEKKEYSPSSDLIFDEDLEENDYIRHMKIQGALCNKLGPLEDIEEELGINALLYLKVMSHQVVYIKGKEPEWGGVEDENEIESYHVMRFTKDRLEVRFAYSDTYATHIIENPLNSYGKVWAVTKEELK